MGLLRLETKVTSDAVERALANLSGKLTNHRPLLVEIGKIYLDSAQTRFKAKQSPTGQQWKRNAKWTIKKKRSGMKGRGPGIEGPYSIGVWTGNLRASIGLDFGMSEVRVGVFGNAKAAKYARTFQEGADAGEFTDDYFAKSGTFDLGAFRSPFGAIPARPFLGPNKASNAKVLKAIETYLIGNQ